MTPKSWVSSAQWHELHDKCTAWLLKESCDEWQLIFMQMRNHAILIQILVNFYGVVEFSNRLNCFMTAQCSLFKTQDTYLEIEHKTLFSILIFL